MTKLMKKIRSVLKDLGHKAKISISVALSIPGFLKIEVEYEKTLAPTDDATRRSVMTASALQRAVMTSPFNACIFNRARQTTNCCNRQLVDLKTISYLKAAHGRSMALAVSKLQAALLIRNPSSSIA